MGGFVFVMKKIGVLFGVGNEEEFKFYVDCLVLSIENINDIILEKGKLEVIDGFGVFDKGREIFLCF